MLRNEHQFVFTYYRAADGSPVGQAPAEVDWLPAVECAQFEALRRGLAPGHSSCREARLALVPHPTAGEPFVEGFIISLFQDAREVAKASFARNYFKDAAEAGSRTLVANGTLKAGEQFLYMVSAYPQPRPLRAKPSPAFSVEEADAAVTMTDVSLSELKQQTVEFGSRDSGDIPVFIPQLVLDEVCTAAAAAGAVEVGGILIGQLLYDTLLREAAVEVTAQIPAREALGESTTLTFTHETWTAVDTALRLRRSQECYLGWWHFHPGTKWCTAACTPEKRRTCPFNFSFFSTEDRTLHRTVFVKPYNQALVVTSTEDGMRHALFGWRHGLVQERGFFITGCSRPTALAEPAAILNAKDPHETTCSH